VVQAVVFDIGGVLLDWSPRYLYGDVLSEDELDHFLSAVCTTEWNLSLDAGRDFDVACKELAAEFPEYEAHIHAWKRQDEMICGGIDGTVAVARELLDRHVPSYLLTNMPGPVFERRRADYEFLQWFDGAVVSGYEGVLKPDPEIFRRLADRFGLEPATTLFIDDSTLNTDAAAALGFQTHRFTSPDELRRDLQARGLV
jgi:2-haloacid dehalogenase